MRQITAKWLFLALALLVLSLGLPGCGSSMEESSSSHSIVLAARFPDNTTVETKAAVLDAAIATIEDRLTIYGVTDPMVKRQGSDQILVKVKNVSSVDVIVKLIKQPAYLEFAEVEMNGSSLATLKDYMEGNRTDLINKEVPGSRMFYITGNQSPVAILYAEDGGLQFVDKDGNPVGLGSLGENDQTAISWMPALGTVDGQAWQLTGMYLTEAKAVVISAEGEGAAQPSVAVKWNDDGMEIFNQIAGRLYGKPVPQNELGIIIDYKLISSPQVAQPQYGGEIHICGDFTVDETKLLAIQLQSGCLPVDFDVVSVS